ncbi:hypothetical protein H8E77_05165 [bacterium]|nr:hypothetical protein [bacterium]
MLRQKAHTKKLSFITIAFLIIGLSLSAPMPARSETESIGSEGGEVYAGHNSSLIVPAGALTSATLITADSFEEVITTDDETILAELNNALSLLDSQFEYIDSLSTVVDDPSGEWAEWIYKLTKLTTGSATITSKVAMALAMQILDDNELVLAYTREALDKLDALEADMDDGLANGKIGSAAYDNIQAYNDDIRATLELVESLNYETLVFEFEPEGTEFLIPAELVIPWDEIIYNDVLFWYSGDGELIDLIDMDYFIDEVNETVHFFIDHFSEYYYPRR